MKLKETKNFIITFVLALIVLSLPSLTWATNFTSTSFTVSNPVIDAGQSGSASTNFGLGQSLSQTAIGKSSSTDFQLWSGFQYYFKVSANVLTATPGASQVALSWAVPQTFLGIAVSSYEVGVGTVSGSYVFTDHGNVTSFTVTGLTNGTPYFFKIKAKSAGGLFLVYSNEATATPTGTVTPPPPPPPGGGGGGGGGNLVPPPPPPGNSVLIIKGLAYPTSQVSFLKDGQVVATTTADPGAAFNVQLSGLGSATYNFGVYTVDKDGVQSPTFSFPETFTSGVTTTVDNIFLGPSIGLSHSIIKKGDTITAFGFTVPDSPVNVTFHSGDAFTQTVTSSSSGAWAEAFNTAVLELGSHTSQSQSQKNSLMSAFSNTVDFAVGDTSLTNTPGTCRRSDLNCDGRVNLTDFSILLYYWQQKNPTNKRADINGSGIVDLTDFSILLYDWTG